MDLTSIIGLLAGAGLITFAIVMGGTASAFWDFNSVLITFGGTLAATLISFPPGQIAQAGRVLGKAFRAKEPPPLEVIATLVSFAEKARREGLLALEDDAGALKDPFMQKGIQLVVDGTDPELVRDILQTELAFIEDRHKGGAAIFDVMGAMAPAFGMIGTIIGLIQMLKTLDDPSSIGAGMATALVTTFYGALAGNLIFIPIANKLRNRSAGEVLLKEVMIEGILSIQSGDNPRIVEEKLKVFLAPKQRRPVRGAKPATGAAGAAGSVGATEAAGGSRARSAQPQQAGGE